DEAETQRTSWVRWGQTPELRGLTPRTTEVLFWQAPAVLGDGDAGRIDAGGDEAVAQVGGWREKKGHRGHDAPHVSAARVGWGPVGRSLARRRKTRPPASCDLPRGICYRRQSRLGTETVVAVRRTRAWLQVAVEQLAAVAEQPVVVQRAEDWNTPRRQLEHDRRREARQVMHVRDVRFELVDDARGDRVHAVVRPRVRKCSRRRERVVDPDDVEAVALLAADGELLARRVRLACQDQDSIATGSERPCVRLCIELRTTGGSGRESVRNHEDAHVRRSPAGPPDGRVPGVHLERRGTGPGATRRRARRRESRDPGGAVRREGAAPSMSAPPAPVTPRRESSPLRRDRKAAHGAGACVDTRSSPADRASARRLLPGRMPVRGRRREPLAPTRDPPRWASP